MRTTVRPMEQDGKSVVPAVTRWAWSRTRSSPGTPFRAPNSSAWFPAASSESARQPVVGTSRESARAAVRWPDRAWYSGVVTMPMNAAGLG